MELSLGGTRSAWSVSLASTEILLFSPTEPHVPFQLFSYSLTFFFNIKQLRQW